MTFCEKYRICNTKKLRIGMYIVQYKLLYTNEVPGF